MLVTFFAFACGCAVTAFATVAKCFYQKKLPSAAEWIPKHFKFHTVLHNYDRTIEETQTRAMMNVVICICFLIVALFVFDRSAPLLKEWFTAKHINNESSWRSILRGIVVATPVVNEAMIIVSAAHHPRVHVVVAMLHFTGCSKGAGDMHKDFLRSDALHLWGRDGKRFRRSIHMKLHELETHIYETLKRKRTQRSGMPDEMENVRHRAMEHRNAPQARCDERASEIAKTHRMR